MAKFTGILGISALIFWAMDMIHGPHNGDAHRAIIHVAEFICFFGFLCLLEIGAFRIVTKQTRTSPWLAVTYLSLASCFLGLALFGLSGGSLHGDGGPIAASFLTLATIGFVAIPANFIVFVVVSIMKK